MEDKKTIENISNEKSKNKKLEILQNERRRIECVAKYFPETIFWRKGTRYECGRSENLLRQLESQIIQSSVETYNLK